MASGNMKKKKITYPEKLDFEFPVSVAKNTNALITATDLGLSRPTGYIGVLAGYSSGTVNAGIYLLNVNSSTNVIGLRNNSASNANVTGYLHITLVDQSFIDDRRAN